MKKPRLSIGTPKTCLTFVLMLFVVLNGFAKAQTTTTVTVPALPLWTNTGIHVSAGETVTVSASGTWCWQNPIGCNGPDGSIPPYSYFVADDFSLFDYMDLGRLIGFIGSGTTGEGPGTPYQGQWQNGAFFPQTSGYYSIGSGQTFKAKKTGYFWLGINDDAVSGSTGDNSGQLTAVITVGGSDTNAPSISISVPGRVYLQGQSVAAKYSCQAKTFPVASCSGTVANGAPLPTAAAGPQTFTVVSTDSNGNASSKDLVYYVGNYGLMPQSLVFAPQSVNTTSKPQTVTLYNSQNAVLTISSVAISGDFAETSTCGSTLAARSKCSFTVTFTPTTTGTAIGNLSVNELSIPVVGNGK